MNETISPDEFAVLVADFLSIGSCFWLLWSFLSMAPQTWEPMLPRQLWWLTLASAFLSIGDAFMVCMDDGLIPHALELTGFFVVVFLEAHIVAGFACVYASWFELLRAMSKTIRLVVGLGLLLGLSETLVISMVASMKNVFLVIQVFIVFVLFIVSFAMCSYTVYRACSYPSGVRKIVWRVAALYMLDFMVTFLPRSAHLLLTVFWHEDKMLDDVSHFLLALSGFHEYTLLFV